MLTALLWERHPELIDFIYQLLMFRNYYEFFTPYQVKILFYNGRYSIAEDEVFDYLEFLNRYDKTVGLDGQIYFALYRVIRYLHSLPKITATAAGFIIRYTTARVRNELTAAFRKENLINTHEIPLEEEPSELPVELSEFYDFVRPKWEQINYKDYKNHLKIRGFSRDDITPLLGRAIYK